MENKEKSQLIEQASGKINEALSILDNVEDDQTVLDSELTDIYYELLDKQSDLDLLGDEYLNE